MLYGINLEFQLVLIICHPLSPSHLLKPKLPFPCLFPWTVWRWKQFVNIIWFNMMTNHSQKEVWIDFVGLIISEAWLGRGWLLQLARSMQICRTWAGPWHFQGRFKITWLYQLSIRWLCILWQLEFLPSRGDFCSYWWYEQDMMKKQLLISFIWMESAFPETHPLTCFGIHVIIEETLHLICFVLFFWESCWLCKIVHQETASLLSFLGVLLFWIVITSLALILITVYGWPYVPQCKKESWWWCPQGHFAEHPSLLFRLHNGHHNSCKYWYSPGTFLCTFIPPWKSLMFSFWVCLDIFLPLFFNSAFLWSAYMKTPFVKALFFFFLLKKWTPCTEILGSFQCSFAVWHKKLQEEHYFRKAASHCIASCFVSIDVLFC